MWRQKPVIDFSHTAYIFNAIQIYMKIHCAEHILRESIPGKLLKVGHETTNSLLEKRMKDNSIQSYTDWSITSAFITIATADESVD